MILCNACCLVELYVIDHAARHSATNEGCAGVRAYLKYILEIAKIIFLRPVRARFVHYSYTAVQKTA